MARVEWQPGASNGKGEKPTVNEKKTSAAAPETANADPAAASPTDGATAGDRQSATPEVVSIATDELAALRQRASERDEFLNLLQRTQADFQNYLKRSQREREQERQFFAGGMIRDLLPVLDNLERALAEAKRVGETGPLVQGVNLVLRQFLDLLQRHGVTRIAAEGEPFDPNLHEALTQQPSAEHPTNTVLHVAEAGYKMNDRVLRPAKVVVSAGPPG